jgi:outer membrane protein assembly factor BamB
MRRLIVVAGILILVGAIGASYYESTHRFGGSVRGTSTEFDPTQTVAAPPRAGQIVSPMFGGVPQHLHVGVGKVRPPFHLDWVSGGTSLVEFPPAIAFHYLYYAALDGNLIAVSTRTGRRLWTVPVGRCEAAGPAVNRLGRGSVFEAFLNKEPCGRGSAKGEGEVLAVSAGRGHLLRWRKRLGVTETSPLIVGNRLYVADYNGIVYCLNASDGSTVWTFRAGGAVKGAIAYDRGRVFFGAYDGELYSLRASDGKLLWRAQSNRDWLGAHGTFYSTPAVAYSRVYLGSTDDHVYSFGERSGKLRWSYKTGGFVYGSPAIWHGRIFVGSYDHWFYAFNAATGAVLWKFQANGPISGSATVVDGIVYFATLQRRTYGLDALTGKQVWTYPDGAFTPVVTDGQKLYVVGWAKVYAFSPKGK